MSFEFVIANEKRFKESLDRLGKASNDFRIPFRLISSDFYRSQKIIFNLKGEGKYPPLGGFNPNAITESGRTKRQVAEDRKEQRTGRTWFPILYGVTGDLKDSTLSANHPNSVFFLGKKELQIGTNVPYGKYHQSDKPRTKLPQRKFIFIDGGPKDASRSSGITGRSERWLNIINDHILQLINEEVL